MTGERRRWPRQLYAGGYLPPGARVRPGSAVTLVDLSRGGALVEGTLRLRWGTRCEFEYAAADGRLVIPARVMRCYVARLDPAMVRYRSALRFDSPIARQAMPDLLAEYQVPGGGSTATGGGEVSSPKPVRPGPEGRGMPPDTRSGRQATWHRP